MNKNLKESRLVGVMFVCQVFVFDASFVVYAHNWFVEHVVDDCGSNWEVQDALCIGS